jgi:hypothetical protein
MLQKKEKLDFFYKKKGKRQYHAFTTLPDLYYKTTSQEHQGPLAAVFCGSRVKSSDRIWISVCFSTSSYLLWEESTNPGTGLQADPG